MCINIIRITAVVIAGLIAFLALSIGGYTTMLKIFSYIPFSPAKSYFNAMKAIEKMEALDETVKIKSGEEYQCGTVKQGETGFRELVEILREKAMLGEEIKEIKLVEEGAAVMVGSDLWGAESYSVVRYLVFIRNSGDAVPQPYNSSDPAQATRDLKYWVEEITRRNTAKWLVVLIFVYMIAGIYLVLTT